MKRKTAKEILAESFREIAAKKPVDKITVPEITGNCGYSKTTFYRLFKDKYDLMAWDYARRQKEIMVQTERVDYEWKTTLIEGAFLFNEQREYLKNLLLHTAGYDSFSRYMKQLHFDSLRKCVLDASGTKELDIKTEMYVRTYCQGTVDLICDWIMGMYAVSPEELAEVFEACLPVPLRRILL
ncbi:MAG: TetR/AcrR family transcriptional regulator C-terminal domain-containing protein [Lachnospiraceae bacterium]|nr:TetR/AcrR family transcriptional regulator C-terminal domain-containing protein [Lachnospiraceae bacterium]